LEEKKGRRCGGKKCLQKRNNFVKKLLEEIPLRCFRNTKATGYMHQKFTVLSKILNGYLNEKKLKKPDE